MDTVKLNTSQNVDLYYPVASVGERIVAQLLDYCFFLGWFFIFSFVISIVSPQGFFLVFLMLLPIIFYHLVFEAVFNGQSPGKMIMKIRVMRKSGQPAHFGNFLIRWVFRIVDVMLLNGAIAVITIAINGKGQRLGDMAAGTHVIKTGKPEKLTRTVYMKLPAEYVPAFPQVVMLSDSDITTIHEALTFYRRNRFTKNAVEVALRTKKAILDKTGIVSDLHPEQFFDRILADYNYYNRDK